MKTIIVPIRLTEEENELLKQAAKNDRRSKCGFIAKAAIENATEADTTTKT